VYSQWLHGNVNGLLTKIQVGGNRLAKLTMAVSCIGSKSDTLVKSSTFLTVPEFGAHLGGKRREC